MKVQDFHPPARFMYIRKNHSVESPILQIAYKPLTKTCYFLLLVRCILFLRQTKNRPQRLRKEEKQL